jgi:hypothetical protein
VRNSVRCAAFTGVEPTISSASVKMISVARSGALSGDSPPPSVRRTPP